MPEIDERINRLQERLENLVKSQVEFQREISQIRYEIGVLRAVQEKQNSAQAETRRKPPVREYAPPPPFSERAEQPGSPEKEPPAHHASVKDIPKYSPPPPAKSNLERFIGENLISKIGIVILIIGVAIGAKYAIDNELITPLQRIIIGYIFGFGLLGFAVKLKSKYHNFSAVLLSGAMAIMYFITLFAYTLYELFNQSTAFVLMLIFTVFTVASALNYNRQIIAHIGLVGAYAIPFLVSEDSGRIAVLFSYIAIINVGILAISVKKYWKPLFYSSFIFTWAVFYVWYLFRFQTDAHFNLALLFLTINFLTFYLTFLAYKLVSHESVAIENVVLILANSFIFYGIGYSILNRREGFENYLGLFTVANAAIHFAFAVAVSRLKLVSRDLVYLLAALVLTFATIAVPVQFDGNFVTLIWTAEAAILFWIGRTKQVSLYEIYSYPLMFLALVSLFADWQVFYANHFTYNPEDLLTPVFNHHFLTSILLAAGFLFIHLLNRSEKYEPAIDEDLHRQMLFIIPGIFLLVLYNAFRMEIGNYFHGQSVITAVSLSNNLENASLRTDRDLSFFNIIWQINYTMLFLTLLSFFNILKIRSFVLGAVNLVLSGFVLLVFLTLGLYLLSELRESFLQQSDADIFRRGWFHIWIRYVSYAFLAGLLASFYQSVKQEFLKENLSEKIIRPAFDFLLFFSLWWLASSELINLMAISGYDDSYKLGLSILWGVYALMLIILGIYQNKKYLRISAIALFGLTLAKVFLYDLADLGTISKTIVFISLGIILLIVSFLYTKYKHLIFETNET